MICNKNIINNLIKKGQAYFRLSLYEVAYERLKQLLKKAGDYGVYSDLSLSKMSLKKLAYFTGIYQMVIFWERKQNAKNVVAPKIYEILPAFNRKSFGLSISKYRIAALKVGGSNTAHGGSPGLASPPNQDYLKGSRLGFPALLLVLFFGIMSCNNSSTNSTPQIREEAANNLVDTSGKTKIILFFGNSLTAGYGVEPEEAYPALIQDKIDSLDGEIKYKVINAGVSGETTSGGNSRIDWILKQPIDIFVLELGANDGLRGIPLATTEQNLQSIIDKVRAAYPEAKIILEGMQIPPNMGREYTTTFKDIYPRLAKENNIELIPFLLKEVAGNPTLNQSDGIHPTVEGHKILAETVWEVLKKDL